uniref:Uncharacterized protein LOC104233968 isoform X2 n=1 Tax=Nicotiana sylvestris TaxID=4096 RepID=A0A1U7XFL5_NICSY|nr:PREDICTED: uncharacterized protein LOC104233968 isoform X2 [Nicotiana sylvestris]XP_009785739.1 PREDICTED: uncharacterized protein LOC104233968 isoform X2 [Nicotiana sylvestris]
MVWPVFTLLYKLYPVFSKYLICSELVSMINCLKEAMMIFCPCDQEVTGSSCGNRLLQRCRACPQISGGSLQPWRRRISFCSSYNRDLSLKTVIGSIQLDRSRGDFAQIGCFEATIYILEMVMPAKQSQPQPIYKFSCFWNSRSSAVAVVRTTSQKLHFASVALTCDELGLAEG